MERGRDGGREKGREGGLREEWREEVIRREGGREREKPPPGCC